MVEDTQATHPPSPAEELGRAIARVRRFLDERARPQPFAPHGFLPVDVLTVLTRTGDRLLASDLRALVEALARVQALADCPPGDCEGHPCVWPEDIAEALSERDGVGTGAARCACPSDVCEAAGTPGCCYFGEAIGRCRTCESNGHHCYPDSDLPLIVCPGEVCATCDYRAGETEAFQ